MSAFDSLRLAGVIHLSLHGRGPREAFVFDPHRLAFSAWAYALAGRPPALLVTLDRHRDLVPPTAPVPSAAEGVAVLDRFAREALDVRNTDHVLAAMEAGLLSDALVIARSNPKGALEGDAFADRFGRRHQLWAARTVERACEGFETSAFRSALDACEDVILDVDLDCFTSLSDADPSVVLPWPREVIRDFLLPPGSDVFWNAVLSKTRALTLAREPYHVGGLVAGGRLFEDVAEVLFKELLRADLP